MTSAADLKAAFDAVAAVGTTAWEDHLTLDGSGNLTPPSSGSYYTLRHESDPNTTDFDGVALSRPLLRVTAWSVAPGAEYGMIADILAPLAALGWEHQRNQPVRRSTDRTALSAFFSNAF